MTDLLVDIGISCSTDLREVKRMLMPLKELFFALKNGKKIKKEVNRREEGQEKLLAYGSQDGSQ